MRDNKIRKKLENYPCSSATWICHCGEGMKSWREVYPVEFNRVGRRPGKFTPCCLTKNDSNGLGRSDIG